MFAQSFKPEYKQDTMWNAFPARHIVEAAGEQGPGGSF